MIPAVLALLAAGGAAAPGASSPVGLWEGTVGVYPVVACFRDDEAGGLAGSYYYRSKRVPIGLSTERGRLVESTAGGASWTVGTAAAGKLLGTWRGKGGALRVALVRKAWTPRWEDGGNACDSRAFFAPLAFSPQFTRTPAKIGGFAYEAIRWKPPAHFADSGFATFAFAPRRPGDRAILAAVAKGMPTGSIDDDVAVCAAQATGWLGSGGSLSRKTRPTFSNARYLAASTIEDSFCGGAHPNSAIIPAVYDRTTGNAVDPARWFTATGFVRAAGIPRIAPALRSVVLKRADPSLDAECRAVLKEADDWRLGLDGAGLVFVPELAHAVQACGDPIPVPWAAAAPFLSAEGRAARAAIAP